MEGLGLIVNNYFLAQYGYQPTPSEVSKSLNELQKGRIHYDFIATTVSGDGIVHESHKIGNKQFDPHHAFVTYVRTTTSARANGDPFISIFLLGVNFANVFGSQAAHAEALRQEFVKQKMSIQLARETLPAFLGTHELRFWKETDHRSFLEKAVEHLELGVQHGYASPENISHAAEALFRLGWQTLEDRSLAYQERVAKALELLSRSKTYITCTLAAGKTGPHDFTLAAQVALQLIRANYFNGTPLQQLNGYVTNFFDSFNKTVNALAEGYDPIIAHTLGHLLGELHKTFAAKSQNGKLPGLHEQLRLGADSLLALMPEEERNIPHEVLDSILGRPFLNK